MQHVRFPKRAIHLDFHTMPGIEDIARDFRADEFADTLAGSGVDYITVFARCNIGFAYYPTKLGTVYPGLKVDLLGEMVCACHERRIRVAAYFNTGIDHNNAVRHRDWCKLTKEGVAHDCAMMGSFNRDMCLNSPYGQQFTGMVDEVLAAYPVDGIFLDCFDLSPCYGSECIEGMQTLGWDPLDDAQVQRFAQKVTDDFLEDMKQRVRAARPDAYLYFNGLAYSKQPTHLELEILPTGGWGYDCLPAVIRYSRTLGKPLFTMTGRFQASWGDFGGLRPYHALLYDCLCSVANAATCSVGDHLHPRGRLEPEVYSLVKKVYSEVSKLDEWADGAEAVTEIALVDPRMARYPDNNVRNPVDSLQDNLRGAARMLSELKYQFDVRDGSTDFSRYSVVILPDSVLVDDALAARLSAFLKGGGKILSSGISGLTPDVSGFALPEYDMEYVGTEPHNPSFFTVDCDRMPDIPDMPVTIYNPGIAVEAGAGREVLANLWRPYSNRGYFDRLHEYLYNPQKEDAGRPAVVRCGPVTHFSFPVFTSYFQNGPIAYKSLVRHCLEHYLPRPLVRTSNVPSFGQVTVTQSNGRRVVHVLTYLPELRGKVQAVEEPIVVRDVVIELRTDGHPAHRAYLAPSRQELVIREDGGYQSVTISEVSGYAMVVFE